MSLANRLVIILGIMVGIAGQCGAQTSSATLTLEDCYQKALRVSEPLQISDQEIRLIELQYRTGVGSVLPDVSWIMTQFFQDTSNVETSTTGVQGTLLQSRRPESYFQVKQPLFHGFREFNALKGYKAANQEARHLREAAMLGLLADVANVFYISLDLQQEVDVLVSQKKLTEDRTEELKRRVRLGKSRGSEVLSAQVDAVSLAALTEDTRRALEVARRTLFFLTQVPPGVPLKDERPWPQKASLEESTLKYAKRPDLLAAQEAREAERYRLKYARGNYWPSLDVTGKYYTEREGFNEDVKWDALFFLEVPIFQGLTTQTEVRAAKARMLITDLTALRLERQVRQEVETAHQNLQYSLSQAEFYKQAVRLAEENYRLQEKEYRLGLINNLEVLRILTQLQDLKLRDLRAQAAAKLNGILLRVSTGEGL